MNVMMLINTCYAGRKFSPGDKLNVSDLTAKRWVEQGVAEIVKAPKKKVAIKKVVPVIKPESIKKVSTSKKVVPVKSAMPDKKMDSSRKVVTKKNTRKKV